MAARQVVFDDVAAKRAREVQDLTEKLLESGLKESDIEVSGVNFDSTTKLLGMATRKAEAIAAAAGQRITGIESINDSWSRIEPRPVRMAFAASDSMMRKAPEMDLGVEYQSTTEVSVHLSVDFQISA